MLVGEKAGCSSRSVGESERWVNWFVWRVCGDDNARIEFDVVTTVLLCMSLLLCSTLSVPPHVAAPLSLTSPTIVPPPSLTMCAFIAAWENCRDARDEERERGDESSEVREGAEHAEGVLCSEPNKLF